MVCKGKTVVLRQDFCLMPAGIRQKNSAETYALLFCYLLV